MRRKSEAKTSRISDRAFNVILTIISTIWLLIVAYPCIYVLSSSFSSGNAVASGKVLLWPVDLSLTGYELVFRYRMIWVGYANTLLYAGLGSILHVLMTIFAAFSGTWIWKRRLMHASTIAEEYFATA